MADLGCAIWERTFHFGFTDYSKLGSLKELFWVRFGFSLNYCFSRGQNDKRNVLGIGETF